MRDIDGELWLARGTRQPDEGFRTEGRRPAQRGECAGGAGIVPRDRAAVRTAAGALFKFEGLPHRVQKVAEIKGVSLSTTIPKAPTSGATVAALKGMAPKVVLIAGGDGKGQDFSPLARRGGNKSARAVVLIGRDRDKIAAVHRVRPESRSGARHRHAGRGAHRLFAWRSRAMPCCCRPRAPASTCFATTSTAHRSSSRKCRALEADAVNGVLGIGAATRPAPIAEFDYAVVSIAALLARRSGWSWSIPPRSPLPRAARFTGNQPTYFLIRHGVFLFVGLMAGFICFQFPTALLAAGRTLSVLPGRAAADAGADSRHRQGSQRQPALAVAGHVQPAAVRTDETVRGAVRGRLHGAQGGTDAQLPQGLPADAGRDAADRRTAAARTGLRRICGDHRDRHGHPVPRRHELEAVRDPDRAAARRIRRADLDLALPPAARDRIHGSLGRSLRQRLSTCRMR